ncbi:hypothetical protein F443_12805, partial [Phytophthora nicotianae P1569]
MLAPGLARHSAPHVPTPSLPSISTLLQVFEIVKEQAQGHSLSAPLFALIAVARLLYQRRQAQLEQLDYRSKVSPPVPEWNVVAEDDTKTLSLVYYPEEEVREETPEEDMESPLEKVLILVIPGNPGNPYYYLPLMQELVKKHGRRHEIRCLSHAGHVMPWKNHNRDFTLQEQIDQKAFYVKQRLREEPTLRLVVIGHSIGSYITLDIAKRFPQNIAKL